MGQIGYGIFPLHPFSVNMLLVATGLVDMKPEIRGNIL
jgi:hypothetical protein